MEERKINLSLLQQSIFAAFIHVLKEKEIPYEYVQEDDGTYSTFTGFLTPMHGGGDTLFEAEADLIASLRVVSESYCDEIFDLKNFPREKIFDILKIIFSSDEELRSCLRGKILDDI